MARLELHEIVNSLLVGFALHHSIVDASVTQSIIIHSLDMRGKPQITQEHFFHL